MTRVVLAICALVGASLGLIAGSDGGRHPAAEHTVESASVRNAVEDLRTRFADVQRDLDAAQTPAAATAARAKLFQLRVDMVAVEDDIAVLARRRDAAREF